MKKRIDIATIMMIEMCMWTRSMCMTFCASISDKFSNTDVTHCAA